MNLSNSLHLFLASLLTLTLTRTISQTVPTRPTMAQCGPRLLAMAPCAPFVEGQIPGPTIKCCDSLKETYMREKDCLCLFLNGTALATLPINSTLALQLPGLCSSRIDPSTCFATSSSGTQASLKSPSSLTAAAPPVDSAPTPGTAEIRKSSGYKLKGSKSGIAALITLMLAKLL